MIDTVLGDRIPRQCWQPLGIHAFDADGIAQLILEVGPEHVDCTIFSIDERQQILREMNNIEVLRRLNIYDNVDDYVDGNPVRINPEQSYWQDDFPIEDIPRENITILRRLSESISWKQGRLLNQFLNAEAAIHIVLATENPHQHWALVLSALKRMDSVPSELNQKLRVVKWLLIETGTGRRPQDVIYLMGMEDDVHCIVCECGGSYVDVLMLRAELRDHPGYRRMRRAVFPSRDDALEMLGEMMAGTEKYRIGEIDTLDLDLEVFLATFAHAPPQLMPSHSVLQRVYDTFGEEVCRERLLPKLSRRLSISKTVEILNSLSNHHEAALRNTKSKILDIFNRYLEAATNRSDFMEVLRQIRLLSREGNWKCPDVLCLDLEGIQRDDLLDDTQSKIVSDSVSDFVVRQSNQAREPRRLQGNQEQKFLQSAEVLKQYFQGWEGAVPGEVIGGFLSLLGNYPKLLELSEQYLGNRTVEGVRAQLDLNWEITPYSSAGGANENIHETMKKQRFLVEVFEDGTVKVTNLLGLSFHARIEQKEFDSLFVGSANEQFRDKTGMNYRVNRIQLLLVQPDRLQRHLLLDFIKNSAGMLLDKVYKQTIQNLDEVFDDLAQSEQLDIKIAQNLLLNSAFFYVQQLEMHRVDNGLSTALQKWDEARRLRTEAEHTGDLDMVNGVVEELQLEQQELQNLIQSDEAAQHSLLTAVRRKIRQYQYTPQCVPFEIFQNADDAVVEHFEMYGDSPQENTDTTRFVIQQEDDKIAFIHWGRPINKFRSAQLDGRARGFHKDLEKMLILSNSDKTESPGNVTGKFGLGFKSVFLVTSKPRVASGQLGFEAMGGFFPKQLTGEPLRELQRQIEACQNDGKEGTIISIQAEECSVQEFLKDFWDVVHFIPVFARKIRRCEWIKNGQPRSWEWNEERLGPSQRICVGELQPMSDGQWGRQTVVVFRASQGDLLVATLLVALDVHGVVKLEKSVPTVWVTVPTKEKCDFGFIVNGSFDLDVGRAQLARDSRKNRDVADSIGREIGDSLIELFNEADRDWDDFCANLDLAVDTDRYEFWHSLWRLFSKVTPERPTNDGDASQLIRRILWNSSNHGMGRLFQQRSAVPSGLWGDYKTLTKRDEIKFKTVGVLDTDESVFCQASQWSQFQQQIKPGHVVSDEQISSILMNLLPHEMVNLQKVKLCDLVQWELGTDVCVDALQASRLGALITREFLNDLNSGNRNQRDEYDELVGLLSNVRFQGSDGVFHIAADLLVKGEGADNPDEPRRAAFAPDNRLLADDYTGSALEFFKACRSGLNAPPELMAEWAVEALHQQARLNVLKYLLMGQLRREVSSEILERIEGTWLRNLATSPLLTDHFDRYDQSIILGELRRIAPPIYPPNGNDADEPRPPDPTVLHRIYEWWILDERSHISRYEESVYGDFRLQLSNQPDWEDSQTRENWLTLFMLGALHTMGRAKPEQHRSFIALWRQNRWLQIVADPQKNLQSWVEIVVDFLDQPGETIQFFNWMRQFASIVQFAYWLEDYGEAFSQIDRLNDDFPLTDITRLQYSSQSQGSDLDAPSIDRTLGIGACFVVRELMRLGVLSSEHVRPHCYAPVGRVSQLLNSIGCQGLDSDAPQRWKQSVTIYEFLCEHLGEQEATFKGAFDIPFLIIAGNQKLQHRFFGSNVSQDEGSEENNE